MNSATKLNRHISIDETAFQKITSALLAKHSTKIERKMLKAFLLVRLYQLFYELFQNKIQHTQNNSLIGYYAMDNKIIQFLIHDIVETEEYTLEGVAFYTHIPFDVIYDAACGVNNQFSITLWAKIIALYIQVKPEVMQILIDKLLEIRGKNHSSLLSLLTES